VNHGKIRDAVRRGYGEMITTGCGCALSCNTGACGPAGYSKKDLAVLPESAIQGLGCGNPTALAGIAPGDTVLDLGAGPWSAAPPAPCPGRTTWTPSAKRDSGK